MIYTLTKTCTFCGFKHTTVRRMNSDFEGGRQAYQRMPPEKCPFCRHAKKLAEQSPQVLASYRHTS